MAVRRDADDDPGVAPSASEHGQPEALLAGALPGDFVASVRVAHDARPGIVPEHARDAAVRVGSAIANDHHAAVLRIAHAHAPTVVQADPGRTAGDVEHGVEQGPVADRVAAVLHGLGFAVGAGDAAAVEVVAADHHRRLQLAVADHLVERQPQPVPLAHAEIVRDAVSGSVTCSLP